MSRVRVLGAGALALALIVGAAGCSKDEEKKTSSDRGTINFADPPEGSTDLGLCYAYDLDQIKELIGGDESFKRLPPAAIGTKTDKVRGESCAWQRTETNGDALGLRIEVRNFGADTDALAEQYGDLKNGTTGAKSIEGLGSQAFSSVSDQNSLLQVIDGPYLLTLSSRADGSLEPVGLDALKVLAVSGLGQLP